MPFTLDKESVLDDFLASNRKSTDALKTLHPEVLKLSGQGQKPHTLWIGCADSRINECTSLGCLPGEIFTLRNIAGVVSTGDLAAMAAIQYAIESVGVNKVVVCGHTDCGGVHGSLANRKTEGPLDNWLLPIRELRFQHSDELAQLSEEDQVTRLVEYNALRSVDMIRKHPSFVKYHKLGKVEVYGVIYDVATGYLRKLELPPENEELVGEVFGLQN